MNEDAKLLLMICVGLFLFLLMICVGLFLFVFFRLEQRWNRAEKRANERELREQAKERREQAKEQQEKKALHVKTGKYYAVLDNIWVSRAESFCDSFDPVDSADREKFYTVAELKRKNKGQVSNMSILGACSSGVSKAHLIPKSPLCNSFHGIAMKFIATGNPRPNKAIDSKLLRAMVDCNCNKIPLPNPHDFYFDACVKGHLFIVPIIEWSKIHQHIIGSAPLDVLVLGDSEETMRWTAMEDCLVNHSEATHEDIATATKSLSTVVKILAHQLVECGVLASADQLHTSSTEESNKDRETPTTALGSEATGLDSQKPEYFDQNHKALLDVQQKLKKHGTVTVPVPIPTGETQKVLKVRLHYSENQADPLALLVKAAMVWSSMTGEKLLPGCQGEEEEWCEDAAMSTMTEEDFSLNSSQVPVRFTAEAGKDILCVGPVPTSIKVVTP